MVCGPSTPLPYARGTLVSGFSTAEATAQPCGEWGQIVSGAASAGLLCLGTDVRHEKGSPRGQWKGQKGRGWPWGEDGDRQAQDPPHNWWPLCLSFLWALKAWEHEGWPHVAPADHHTTEFPPHRPIPGNTQAGTTYSPG